MVELELLQPGQRPVATLEEREALPLLGGRLVQLVVLRLRVEQERPRDEEDASQRERRAEHERECHARAAAYP